MSVVILSPNTVEPSGSTLPVLRVSYAFPEGLVGKRVRLLVYDWDLFVNGLGVQEGLGSAKGDTLFKFKEMTPLSPAELAPSDSDGRLGFLFRTDLMLGKTLRKGERYPTWWTRPPADSVEANPPRPLLLIQLSLLQDDLTPHIIGNLRIHPNRPLVRSFTGRWNAELLVRIAVLEPVASLYEGGVLFSNLRRDPKRNPSLGPVRVILPAAGALPPAQIGGAADTSPAGIPPATSRLVNPDLTGFWEAYETDPAVQSLQEPSLMVQFNQAGHALVGWLNWPHPGTVRQQRDVRPLATNLPGALLCERKANETVTGSWMQGTDPTVPIDVSSPNVAEPFDLIPPANPDSCWQLVFRSASTNQQSRLFLYRVNTTTRWPGRIVQHLSGELGDYARTFHVRPFPRIYWIRLLARLEEGGDVNLAIRAWYGAPTSPPLERMKARERVSDLLLGIASSFAGSRPEQQEVVARFRRFSVSTILTMPDKKVASAHGWLGEMVEEEMTALRQAQPDAEDDTLFDQVRSGFRAMGIHTGGSFLYRMTFQAMGTTVVVAGVYSVTAEIKRFRVSHEVPIEDSNWSARSVRVYGTFVDIGFVLKLKGLALGGGAVSDGDVDFRSYTDLKPRDFEGAKVTVTATKVGGIGLPMFDFTAAGASYMAVTVSRPNRPDVVLESSSEKVLDAGLANKHDLRKFDPKPEITLVEVSHGRGTLSFDKPNAPKAPRPHTEEAHTQVDRSMASKVNVYFEKDRATIPPMNQTELEEVIALNRILFDATDGWLRVAGNCSPEGTEDYNQRLSEARAASVLNALRDALGPALRPKDVESYGNGEDEARMGVLEPGHIGLVDPESAKDQASRKLWHEQSGSRWPDYRRVDIVVQGLLVAVGYSQDK